MAAKQNARHLQVTSATQLCQKLARIDTESLGDVEKLNDVQPTLTPLVLGHEGLWAAQHIGNPGLGGPFGFARRNQPL
ncbi:hypothetical protein X760_22350 [Mesorhizobium sp. LSHC422A00]|nr:hypothetical protein X760_22350 [Mesorhizobium sp. LSHC422A00]